MQTAIFSFNDLVLVIACFYCLLMSVIILQNSHKDSSSKFLFGFFICIAFSISGKLILWNSNLIHIKVNFSSPVTFFYITACLLKGPFLYFYVSSLTHKNFTLTIFNKSILILPFVISGICILMGADTEKLTREPYNTTPFIFITVGMLGIVPWFFATGCLYQYQRAKQLLKNFYSGSIDTSRLWLFGLIIAFIIMWSWGLIAHFMSGILADLFSPKLPHFFGIANDYLSFLAIVLLYQYSVSSAFLQLNHASEISETDKKYRQIDINQVIQGMKTSGSYLEPNLNLERFSDKIELHPKEVSQVINSELKCNFFEFVNRYRVQRAKELLLTQIDLPIKEVMSQSGFNSQSSFYRIFRSHTGHSPKQFKKSSMLSQNNLT